MIRISPIRLIGPDGEQVGIVETAEALRMAQESGLDLVEVSPDARPPVCKLLDYGKHKYEQSRMERQSRKNSTDSTPKEVRFRPNTGQHDLEVKIDGAKKFLDQGLRVRLTVRFRGAEMRRQDVGRATLRKATEMLEGCGKLDNPIPEVQGRMLSVTMLPNPKKGPSDKPEKGSGAEQAKTAKPAAKEAKPAAKKAEKAKPAAKEAKPAAKKAEKAKPAAKEEKPAAKEEKPAAKEEKPAAKKAEKAKPAAKKAEKAKPAAKEEKPAAKKAEKAKPATKKAEKAKPAAKEEKPAAKKATSDEAPAGDEQTN